jgi:Domain of unknown function (DUF3598)
VPYTLKLYTLKTMQWQGLLQNLGIWQGSFTELSPNGAQLQDTPSELSLSLSADEKVVELTLKRFPIRADPQEITLNFNYPGPGPKVPFFESGCFSQGSLQWSTWGQFGNEFAFIEGDRRLRLVQLYRQGTDLSSLTLIRESRAGSSAPASPPLTVDDLLGNWDGEATTLYPDGRLSPPIQTYLQVQQDGDRLWQALQFGPQTIRSSARIEGNCLHFDEGAQPMQLLCLPGGASSLCPAQIQPNLPFMVEAGWLVEPNSRKRLMRSYCDRGEWKSITLVTEHKR